MDIQEQVLLAGYTTMKVGGPARFFVHVGSEDDLLEAFYWSRERGITMAVLGGGSNLLASDNGFDGLVVHITTHGIEQAAGCFDVSAGEDWDRLVDYTLEANCGGMECLAGIPGSVGASPVQNIGAYGQDVSQTIVSVRALDRHTGQIADMPASACGFQYRKSIFNTEQAGRYVITRVRFQLRPDAAPQIGYADLQRWFAGHQGTPTLAEAAAAVRSIRRAKGMVLIEGDPDTCSAGSYFKNPVVPVALRDRVAQMADSMPQWPAGNQYVKLSAAWLMEQAGFGKGYRLGAAGLSTKHALALTNRGGATCLDVLRLETAIREGVRDRFGILLEREPVMLG